VSIRDLRDDERAWANATYRAIRFLESGPEVRVQLVAEHGDQRIGLGRLVELAPGVVELGGIWTAEAMRGRGVARAMVDELLARSRGPLWCIPFVHLLDFYTTFGFRPARRPWPAAIAAKVDGIVAASLPAAVVLFLDRPAGVE